MRYYISRGGRNIQKYRNIDEKVYEDFCEWKQKRFIVHDRDLLESAMLAAEHFQTHNFEVFFAQFSIFDGYPKNLRLLLLGYCRSRDVIELSAEK